MMWWKSLFVFLSLVLSNIYCENYYWPNDDDGQSEKHQMSFDEHRQQYNSRHHHHQQGNMESTKMANIRTISETYADSGGSDSIPIDRIVNQKNARRTNNRRRKIGSRNSNKKSIFRRGQRHRNNKNGNVHSSRQQISLCFHFSLFIFFHSMLHFLFLYHSFVCLFVFILFTHYTLHNQRNNEAL